MPYEAVSMRFVASVLLAIAVKQTTEKAGVLPLRTPVHAAIAAKSLNDQRIDSHAPISKSDTICNVHTLSGHIVNAQLNRISIDPRVCFGQPCIKGTRIWVSLVLDLLAEGLSEQQILIEYPQLKREDILAALAYGAEMAREHIIPIATENAA
jgi:uncharacterized protein (DUF433 family)